MPALFYFHGQYGTAMDDASKFKYKNVGEKNGYVSVFGQGLGDGNCGTGWNVGSGNQSATCTSDAGSCCYDSCKALHVCTADNQPGAKCGWSTCHSDIAFLASLVTHLSASLCLDLDALFVTGGSNGGMMTHYIYSQLAPMFAAYVPMYGLPLMGFAIVPTAASHSSIMALHDRSDQIIPANGGLAGGWYYESTDTVYEKWAAIKGCNAVPHSIVTPFDGPANANLACLEYGGCRRGRVIRCLYDGTHGSQFRDYATMTWWFFAQTIAAQSQGETSVLPT